MFDRLLGTQKRLYKKAILLLILFIVTFSLSPFLPSNQANEMEIRVALFVDIGKAYRGTVPFVSMESSSGLDLVGETGKFQNMGDASYIRFTADQYYLIAGETKSASEARNISTSLAALKFTNLIVSFQRNDETWYRVITQSEFNYSDIVERKKNFDQARITTSIAGPFRVQAGSFSTLESALQRQSELQKKGFVSAITQVITNKNLTYQVWVGSEINAEEQAKLSTALKQAFPSWSFSNAAANEYIIYHQTPIFNEGNTPLYFISTTKKLNVSPKASGLIPLVKVEERSNRSYRGKMELSTYNQKFTLVNILPLEHYLYSVVGTEMSASWPLEALKVQAIMARNYAYNNITANKYGIAHLSDTTYEQAYYGYDREASSVRSAVDGTKGEFITYKGTIFTTFFYSNAGGMTAEGKEVWGTSLETHSVVESDDIYPQTLVKPWYRVQDKTGKIGYVHSMYVDKTTEKSTLGFTYGVINISSLNYRTGPSTKHDLVGSLKLGEKVIILEETHENNAYSWIRGPYTGVQIQSMINAQSAQKTKISQPVWKLEVTETGVSKRVIRMQANDQAIARTSPDSHRSIFQDNEGSLLSTKFNVESMGQFSVIGASGQRIDYPQKDGSAVKILSLKEGSTRGEEVNPAADQFVLLAKGKKTRVVAKQASYRFIGNGFGHGLGASQFGVRALASKGYDYRQILKHYFHKDSVIEKRY